MLIKSTDCQRDARACKTKATYMDVSDRRLLVRLTQEAKNASDFSLIRAIFAFAGFVSALAPGFLWSRRFSCRVDLGECLARRDVAQRLPSLIPSPRQCQD